jgi:hypothetical protein
MEPTDQDLLAATAAGDGDAFAMFWRRHLRIVMGFGIHRCATSEDVADLVADTFWPRSGPRAATGPTRPRPPRGCWESPHGSRRTNGGRWPAGFG